MKLYQLQAQESVVKDLKTEGSQLPHLWQHLWLTRTDSAGSLAPNQVAIVREMLALC